MVDLTLKQNTRDLEHAHTQDGITNAGDESTSRARRFDFKHGHKHHPFDKGKAPYPMSYDRHILDKYVYVQTVAPICLNLKR